MVEPKMVNRAESNQVLKRVLTDFRPRNDVGQLNCSGALTRWDGAPVPSFLHHCTLQGGGYGRTILRHNNSDRR